MAKIINGSSLYLALANYLASNAYLNDTAQDVLEMVCVWIDEAKAIQVPKWIPVTERLPETKGITSFDIDGCSYEWEKSCFVLGCDVDGDIHCVQYIKDEESQWWEDDPGEIFDITHWMPLPEPPKEDA